MGVKVEFPHVTNPDERRGNEGGDSDLGPEVPSRTPWRLLSSALIQLGVWAMAIVGLDEVFAAGEWQLAAIATIAATICVAALVRMIWPRLRLGACMGGLIAGATTLAVMVYLSGRIELWVTNPQVMIEEAQLDIFRGVPPMDLSGPLLDLLLVAVLLGAWVGALLSVGLDAHLPAALVPALLLLIPTAVVALPAPVSLLAGAGALVCAMMWVASPGVRTWQGVLAGIVTFALAAGLAFLLPPARDRVLNTQAVSVAPIAASIPDVTIALGEDLRRGSTADAFRFRGAQAYEPLRFTLAQLTDFSGGTWHPESHISGGPDSAVTSLRTPWVVPDDDVVDQSNLRAQRPVITTEILSLVSDWLPLPVGSMLMAPGSDTDWDPNQWQWVDGTQTARSQDGWTRRGDTYLTWGFPHVMSSQWWEQIDLQYVGAWMPLVVDHDPALDPMLEVPADLPAHIGDIARDVTEGTQNDLQTGVLLMRYFLDGSFTYDEEAPYAPGTDPNDPYQTMETFVEVRRGYCVHFATTFAVMARTLGVPSRVAVGYAAGSSSETWTYVQGRDLHAWPELYIENVGWVGFEPTPGGAGYRADRRAAGGGASEVGPDDPSPEPTPSDTPSASPEPSQAHSGAAAGGGAQGGDDALGINASVLVWLVGAVLFGGAGLAPGQYRRGRRRARVGRVMRGDDPGVAAWEEVIDTAVDLGVFDVDGNADRASEGRAGVAIAGLRAQTTEAVVEFLVGTGRVKGAEDDLDAIANRVVAERFSRVSEGGETSVESVAEVRGADLEAVIAALVATSTPGQRFRARWVPNSLVERSTLR